MLKKLAFRHETLRPLDLADLATVRGGIRDESKRGSVDEGDMGGGVLVKRQ